MKIWQKPRDAVRDEDSIDGLVTGIAQTMGGTSSNVVYRLRTEDGEVVLGSWSPGDEVRRIIDEARTLGANVSATAHKEHYPTIGFFGWGLFPRPLVACWQGTIAIDGKDYRFRTRQGLFSLDTDTEIDYST